MPTKRTAITFAAILVVAVIGLIAWNYFPRQSDGQPQTNLAVDDTITTVSIPEEEPELEPEPVKRLVITASASSYQFPAGAKTSFDANGDLRGGAFVEASNNNASFVGRDLYILQQLNATIDLEVNPDAGAVVFPASLRFSTDHDGIENVTGWQCGDAYMSDRDSYLLYALTEIRRGRSAASEPSEFFAKLPAVTDSTGNYTAGQCIDVDGVALEGRDRYLLDMINKFSIVIEVVQ